VVAKAAVSPNTQRSESILRLERAENVGLSLSSKNRLRLEKKLLGPAN